MLYDDPNLGIRRAARASRTLEEFLHRQDAMEGVVAFYAQMTEELEGKGGRGAGSASLALGAADCLVMYPSMFDRTKGHEADLLQLLCERHRKMTAINQELGDDAPYGVAFNTMRALAVRLLDRLEPPMAKRLRQADIEEEPRLYREIEALCSRTR
jgi:hypothetical protein